MQTASTDGGTPSPNRLPETLGKQPADGRSRLKRSVLVALIALATINLWTGSPMAALWIGSRVQGGGAPTMRAVFLVAIVMAALSLVLVRAIAAMQNAYDELTGHPSSVRTHVPWLRSMRGERKLYPGERPQLTAPERVLISIAVIAVLILEIWFFFFSGSPIDQQSGRGELPSYTASR